MVEEVPLADEAGMSGGKIFAIIAVIIILVSAMAGVYWYVEYYAPEDVGGGGGNNTTVPNGDAPGTNTTPEVAMSFLKDVYANTTVEFRGSTNHMTEPVTYTWTFNDPSNNASNPNTADGKTVTHSFATPGRYRIDVVAVSGNDTATDSDYINITPEIEPGASYNLIKAPAAYSGYNYTIQLTNVVGSEKKMYLGNFRWVIYTNGSDPLIPANWKMNGTMDVTPAPATPTLPPTPPADGMYLVENADGFLSSGDLFALAGADTLNIDAGDEFNIIYLREDVLIGDPAIFN